MTSSLPEARDANPGAEAAEEPERPAADEPAKLVSEIGDEHAGEQERLGPAQDGGEESGRRDEQRAEQQAEGAEDEPGRDG